MVYGWVKVKSLGSKWHSTYRPVPGLILNSRMNDAGKFRAQGYVDLNSL